MQRWAIVLAAYDYELVFRPTQEHGNADTLSRLPLPSQNGLVGYASCSSMEFFPDSTVTFRKVDEETKKGPFLQQVEDRLMRGWREEDHCSELAPFTKRR